MRPATHAPATSTLHTHAVAAANAQTDARARGKVKRLSASRPERGAGTQRSRASTRREVTKRQHKIYTTGVWLCLARAVNGS